MKADNRSTGKFFCVFLALLILGACSRNEPEVESAPKGTPAATAEPAPPAAKAFHGLGQEPGWMLDIVPGEHIDFEYDYGEQRAVTPVPQPVVSGRQTVYHAVTEANDLKIDIVEEDCADVMSGQPFPATVRVTLNGKTYDGCGEFTGQKKAPAGE